MRFQSKSGAIPESESKFAPIRLSPDFPVSEVDVNIRGEVSDVPPHIHDCLELGFCYSGEGLFWWRIKSCRSGRGMRFSSTTGKCMS